jgi:DNA-binding transcriptional ArsR family regulator
MTAPADGAAGDAALAERQQLYDARAKVLKALAHPTRLYIVDRLARRECCVCELQELVGADMSTVSKHLSVLKAAGVVADDKRGKQVWYRLRVPCLLNFFGCVEEVLRQDAAEKSALVSGERR